MPQFTKLTPNLLVANVERSLAFYVDTLGLTRGMTVPDESPLVFASVVGGESVTGWVAERYGLGVAERYGLASPKATAGGPMLRPAARPPVEPPDAVTALRPPGLRAARSHLASAPLPAPSARSFDESLQARLDRSTNPCRLGSRGRLRLDLRARSGGLAGG